MVVKALTTTPLVVREAKLLLEFLIVPLNAPAHLGDEDQLLQGGFSRRRREKILDRLGLTFRSFDQ